MNHRPTDRGKMWYFYANMDVIYFATFDPEHDKVPAKFHGPFGDKQEAREAREEWAEAQEEGEYEYTE